MACPLWVESGRSPMSAIGQKGHFLERASSVCLPTSAISFARPIKERANETPEYGLDVIRQLRQIVVWHLFAHVRALREFELHRVQVLVGPAVMTRDVAALEAAVYSKSVLWCPT